ncbi:unknown protein [Seminavis robusta]|uniref:Uncharacterized protein n=1 Tax=Seminavis robusta TaxID=568900 RepID=A0A9N8EPM3_9STRA|nr:unknown protein [Seminavis robusta]|eukprot:Sro1297_g260540.1 n/a (1046) ;mRNA; f:26985-30122
MAKRRTKKNDAAETPGKLTDRTNCPSFSPAYASPPPKRGLLSLTTPNFNRNGGLFRSPFKESPVSRTKSVATQTDPIPCLGFAEEIIARNPSQQLQQQVFNTLSALHLQQNDKNYVRLSLRHGQQTYLKIPNSRTCNTKNANAQITKRINKNSTLIFGLLQRLFGGNLQQVLPAFLTRIGKQFQLAVLPIHECGLTIVQAAAVRDLVPTSTRGLERLANALHDSAPFLGNLLFPKQLRRRISEFEKCSLDVELSFEVVSLEMNGEGKMKPCVHAWVSNPPIIIEGLTRSALIAGKFQESESLSSHKGEILVVQGCDKGGNLTLSLTRIANRLDGNAPQFCFPLAFYEDGRESYWNLARTIYDNSQPSKKPVQPFLQSLLNGKHHMIVASASRNNEDIIDAQCLAVECTGYNIYEKSKFCICDICDRLLPDADHRELLVSVDQAKAQKQPTIIPLDRLHSTALEIRLVLSNPADKREESSDGIQYSGMLVYQSSSAARKLVARLSFTAPLLVPPTADVALRCYACRPFTADDLKLNIAVSGQGTASSKYPCPICIASKDELNLCVHGLTPSPTRTGENSNNRLYEIFQSIAGGRALKVANDSSAASMAIKLKAKSVVNRPLLLTPPSQNTAGSMHVCQGIMTHLTRRTFSLLREIDRKSTWFAGLKDAVKDSDNTQEIKDLLAELHRQDRSLFKQLQAATKWPEIPSQVERAANLLAEREQLTVQSGMEAWALVQKAATELSAAGSKFLKDSGSKPEGIASYLLYQSFCIDGGIRFNVEHSGLELTNKNGIKVLAKYEQIANRVDCAYEQGNDTHLQAEVKAVMSTWRNLAQLLLELGTILKRQSKLSAEEIKRLKECSLEYGRQWTTMIQDNDSVFNKLHTLIAHLTSFAEEHNTIGLVNEESFEATHPRAQTISTHVRSMVTTGGKVQKTVQRFSLGLNSEYQSTRTSLQDNRKCGPRKLKEGDKYKSSQQTRQHDVAPITNPRQGSKLPEGLVFVDTNESVVKEAWIDYYNYLVCGRVPANWKKPFGDDDEIGNVFKVKSEYV